MIHHVSFAAREPERVARAIAALWRGEAMPFVIPGAWIAMAGDDRGTQMEIYPAGLELRPGEPDAEYGDAPRVNPSSSPYTSSHAAIASPLSEDEIHALAAREGWTNRYNKRGGAFGVIEVWVENSFLLEVLTPAMQAEYTSFVTPQNLRELLAKGPPQPA